MIELILFDDVAAVQPAKVIPLDASRHRTYHYWHAFVRGLKPGQVYAYRAHGPFAPQEVGYWFDGTKVLLDPYGLACRPGRLRPQEGVPGRRRFRRGDEERRRGSHRL